MHVSHKSLLTISLLWGGACLSQVYCAPVSHDGITSGSEVQLRKLKQREEALEVDPKGARVPTIIPKEPTEIDISVLTSPSTTNDPNKLPNNDADDGNEKFRYWFEVYMELFRWLGIVAKWLWQDVLPFALFLAACVATLFFGLGLVTLVLECLTTAVSDRPTERTWLLN